MSLQKQYAGYRSFSYLEAGVDYEPFELADEVDRVAPYRLPLSDEEEARVRDLTSTSVSFRLELSRRPSTPARGVWSRRSKACRILIGTACSTT